MGTVTGQEQYSAIPYISFHCSCGKVVYSISTNAGGLTAAFVCPCGIRYACKESLIALEVDSPEMQRVIQSTHSPEDRQPCST